MQLKNDVQQKTQQLASQEKEMTSLEQKIQESKRGKEDSVGGMLTAKIRPPMFL